MVVTAVGNDQQSLLRILGLAHLGHAEVNGVEQRGAAAGDGVEKPTLDVIDRTGEVGNLLRLVGEGDHEELILRVGGLEELDHSFAGAIDLAGHASAHVENHADRHRGVFAGERFDLLLVFAFENVEVLAIESRYQPVERIGDGDRHQHHVHVHF